MKKVNCYLCFYRRDISGDTHSRCVHPKAGGNRADPIGEMFAILAGAGRIGSALPRDAVLALNIRASPHGILNGWFSWPYNFDPVWLLNCDGFTPTTKEAA